MYRINTLTAVIVVTCMMALAGTAAASAAEMISVLPEPSKTSPITYSTPNGEQTFETAAGTKMECKSGLSLGSITKANLGTVKLLLEKCESTLSATCTGLNQATSGDVNYEGTVDFWLAKAGSQSVVASVYLLNEARFTCTLSGIKTLEAVKGCAAGQLSSIEALADLTMTRFSGSKGANEITKVLPEGGTKEIECKLESSIAGAKSEQADVLGNELQDDFVQNGKETNIELTCGGCVQARVTASPNRHDFGNTLTTETKAVTVTYTNQGPGDWEPTGAYIQYKIIGPLGSFDVTLGLTPCNKKIEPHQKCEMIYEFKPVDKVNFLFTFEVTPGGELIGLEGIGV